MNDQLPLKVKESGMKVVKAAHSCCLFALVYIFSTVLWAQTPPSVVEFASDRSWGVFTSDPYVNPNAGSVGNAQLYCLNASSPRVCPAGATNYGNPANG